MIRRAAGPVHSLAAANTEEQPQLTTAIPSQPDSPDRPTPAMPHPLSD